MELVLLHALPLDGSMWIQQQELIPGATYAPTLYSLGNSVSEWASAILSQIQGDRLIVVGNSVGGSCALEMAAIAQERIAALVLIGAKAGHSPDPELHANGVSVLYGKGVEAAWEMFWAPLFSRSAFPKVLADAKRVATDLPAHEIANGVTAFHTRVGRKDLLPTLQCPVLCISGEYDVAPGLAITAAQAKSAQNGRLIIVPDSGRYVPIEQPERLNTILQSLIHELS
jgi:pimeloyl-ACP methyl ester carboxylesterase